MEEDKSVPALTKRDIKIINCSKMLENFIAEKNLC